MNQLAVRELVWVVSGTRQLTSPRRLAASPEENQDSKAQLVALPLLAALERLR